MQVNGSSQLWQNSLHLLLCQCETGINTVETSDSIRSLFSIRSLAFRGVPQSVVKTFMIFQSWARHNNATTTWPSFQATKLLVIAWFLYSLRLLHLDTKTLNFFEFILVPKALLRCRVVATLCNCRLPSSVIYYTVSLQFLNTVAKKKNCSQHVAVRILITSWLPPYDIQKPK